MHYRIAKDVLDSYQKEIDELKLRNDLFFAQLAPEEKEPEPIKEEPKVFVVDTPLKKKKLCIVNPFERKKENRIRRDETIRFLDKEMKRAFASMEELIKTFKLENS